MGGLGSLGPFRDPPRRHQDQGAGEQHAH
jgi:hypothetical protein